MLEIEFDPAKDAINRRKHGISLSAAAVILKAVHFRQRSSVPNTSNEDRWIAVGLIEHDLMTCIYTMRSGVCRVISLRAARAKEKREYEQTFRKE